MTVLVSVSTIAAEHVADVEAAGSTLFAAVQAAAPEGFRYSTCRLPDGVSYVTILEIPDGTKNPLVGMPEFQDFVAGLDGWLAAPTVGGPATVIGSYRVFGTDPS